MSFMRADTYWIIHSVNLIIYKATLNLYTASLLASSKSHCHRLTPSHKSSATRFWQSTFKFCGLQHCKKSNRSLHVFDQAAREKKLCHSFRYRPPCSTSICGLRILTRRVPASLASTFPMCETHTEFSHELECEVCVSRRSNAARSISAPVAASKRAVQEYAALLSEVACFLQHLFPLGSACASHAVQPNSLHT